VNVAVTASRPGLLATWPGRAAALAAVSAALLVVSGALATIYFRPYGGGARVVGPIGVAVVAAPVLRVAHRVGAHALLAAVAALVVFSAHGRGWMGTWMSGWRGTRAPGRAAAVAALALLPLSLASGYFVPWQRLVPWAPVLGANMARPMPLLGHEGPFPELVGVNVRYDDALVSLGRWRIGPRGVGRVYFTHLVVLPLALAGLLAAASRSRRRAPPSRDGGH
jgi:quinol-cytochrome oxidoreductase complex cytochrome b subunit